MDALPTDYRVLLVHWLKKKKKIRTLFGPSIRLQCCSWLCMKTSKHDWTLDLYSQKEVRTCYTGNGGDKPLQLVHGHNNPAPSSCCNQFFALVLFTTNSTNDHNILAQKTLNTRRPGCSWGWSGSWIVAPHLTKPNIIRS